MTNTVKIFRDFNITYWLNFGTLVGAYRHGGFVPWDHDADLSIPFEDRKKLQSEVVKERLGAVGLVLNRGYSSCGQDGWALANAYIKRYVKRNMSRLDFQESRDNCDDSVYLYKVRQREPRLDRGAPSLDIYFLLPVTIEHQTLFTPSWGSALYSRSDMFPLQRCWFNNHEFTCPARSRYFLTTIFGHSLHLPYYFDEDLCKLVENRQDS